jgi:hypothetical protein
MINLLYKFNNKCNKILTGIYVGFLLYIFIDEDYKLFNINIFNKKIIILISTLSYTYYLLYK